MEFSNYRETKRRNKCCVIGCQSTTAKNTNLSFHAVPKSGVKVERENLFGVKESVDKRSEWLRKLKLSDCYKDLFVCSKHFKPSDYVFADATAARRVLKTNAIPTCESQSEQYKRRVAASAKRAERCVVRSKKQENYHAKKVKKRQSLDVASGATESVKSTTHTHNNSDASEEFVVDESNIDLLLNSIITPPDNVNVVVVEPEKHDDDCEELQKKLDTLDIETQNKDQSDHDDKIQENSKTQNQDQSDHDDETQENSKVDKSIQVNTDNFVVTLSSHIKTESDLVTMCNIKSFSILDELTKIMDEIYPRKRRPLINTRDSIILTLTKLKLDISFSALAVLFNSVTEVTIRNTFYDTVNKLSTILQCVIGRVSKEEIKRNMPLCFEKYQATTSVLDCTEIKIQTPKCLKCKLKFYSHYKGDLTVKYMTEVTPAGLITFVSETFGGRASDKAIFNHSGILKHMESTRDAVMVDRGFLIDDECLERQIKLIRPPFLKNKPQFTKSEAIENKEIACARVHIERMNQRIKLFQILNHKFPWHMIDYVEDIFIICCGFANLGSPILADDKFF